MKYIKLYEELEELPKLKKYIIWQLNARIHDTYVVCEILQIYRDPTRKNIHERIFLEVRRLAVYDGLEGKWLDLDNFLIVDTPYNKYEILYESDNLQDCINTAELLPKSKKFNI
jgi:hypothetical protein